MSNAIALKKDEGQSLATVDQKRLVKSIINPHLTDDELTLYLHRCQAVGVDPLSKQLIMQIRRSKNKDTGNWERTPTFILTRDGFLARANKFSDYRGILSGVVYREDEYVADKGQGTVRHIRKGMGGGRPMGAWAIVKREGHLPYVAEVLFSEYQQQAGLWGSSPAVMIEKVAQATALRRAYPDAFAQVYESSEMTHLEFVGEEKSTKQLAPPPGPVVEHEKPKAADEAIDMSTPRLLFGDDQRPLSELSDDAIVYHLNPNKEDGKPRYDKFAKLKNERGDRARLQLEWLTDELERRQKAAAKTEAPPQAVEPEVVDEEEDVPM